MEFKDRKGQSAAQKRRQNRRGTFVSLTLALMAAFLLPATASAQPNVAPPTVQTAAETAAAIRAQLGELGQRVQSAPCLPTQYRVGIPVPIPGTNPVQTVTVAGCITSDHPPCNNELEGARRVFIEARDASVRQRVQIAFLMHWRSLTERRLARIEARDDRQDGDLAALEVLQSQTLAYVSQLGGPWAQSVVDAIGGINGNIATLSQQLQQIRADLTTETGARQQGDSDEARVRREADERHDRELANDRRNRPRLGPSVDGLYVAGPGEGASFAAAMLGATIVGHPFPSVRGFIGTARLATGYGETTAGPSRGVWVTQAQAGVGYEWQDVGRVGVAGGFTLAQSTRWQETTMMITGGVHVQGEFDISRAIVVTGDAGWEWGSGVNPNTGVNIDGLSRYQLRLGLNLRF